MLTRLRIGLDRARDLREAGRPSPIQPRPLIDTRCVLIEMLHDDERAWLNTYHATVRERVGRHLSGDAKAWLDARTQPI